MDAADARESPVNTTYNEHPGVHLIFLKSSVRLIASGYNLQCHLMNTLDFVQIFHAADRLWIPRESPINTTYNAT